jgi:hypothetical protein
MIPLRTFPLSDGCEVRFGLASWSKPNDQHYSVKYSWPDTRGRSARGGEVPLHPIARMLIMALESSHIELTPEEKRELRRFVN